eukprot:5495684-Prymnesium_polylepis.1
MPLVRAAQVAEIAEMLLEVDREEQRGELLKDAAERALRKRHRARPLLSGEPLHQPMHPQRSMRPPPPPKMISRRIRARDR